MPQKSPFPQESNGLIIRPSSGLVSLPEGGSPALSEIIRRSLAHIQAGRALPIRERRAGEEREFEIAPGVKVVMCWIPPGEFLMGSPEDEVGRNIDESSYCGSVETQRRVTITQGFWLGKFTVTQSQWEAVMQNNPSEFKGSNLPVETVSWNEISEPGGFMDKVNCFGTVGRNFFLPTEAQWEYACRAGTTTALNSGKDLTTAEGACPNLDEVAWYEQNSIEKTHAVGQKKANAWGLHDMHGNVWEWCVDWHGRETDELQVDPRGADLVTNVVGRGGSCVDPAYCCRVAVRPQGAPWDSGGNIGFRVASSSVPLYIKTSKELVVPERRAGEEQEFEIAPGVKIVMCWIPPGDFMMGSPEDEVGRRKDETQHPVTITQGFWLGKYQVTQAQWEAVMGSNPSEFKGFNLPVECVSWNGIFWDESGSGGFVGKLNKMMPTGGRFHLPTEAQWEYACRAGKTGPYAGDLDEIAWYEGNCVRYTTGETHPVGLKRPNSWGLHDMHGNVQEWCEDWYESYDLKVMKDPAGPTVAPSGRAFSHGDLNTYFNPERILRGGKWLSSPRECRSASRGRAVPGYYGGNPGFRLARSPSL